MTRTTIRTLCTAVAALLLMGVSAQVLAAQEEQAIQDTLQQQGQDTLQQAQIDAPSGYLNASEVAGLPQFVPGLGILFVKEENLPVGPFLAYGPDGKHLSTVLFVPTSGMGHMEEHMPGQEEQAYDAERLRQQEEEERQRREEQEYGQQEPQRQAMPQQQLDPNQLREIELEKEEVDHVEIRFSRGFATASSGLDQPHYQVILWHVSSDEARELEQLGLAQGQTPEEIGQYGEGEQEQEYRQREETLREEEARREEDRREEEARTDIAVADVDAPSGFEKASDLAQLPEFIPNVGMLYVEPNNVPFGPFLAYDRDGELVSTVFMVPAEENQQATIEQLQLEKEDVDHVAIEFSQGFDGAMSPLDRPHYHVILWHISPEEARDVSRFQGDTGENR